MKKFSKSDLLSSFAINGAGKFVNRFFESKYEVIYISIPELDYKRGNVFILDINDLIRTTSNIRFSIEKLLNLLYLDLLRQVQQGLDLEAFGYSLMEKKQQQEQRLYKTVKSVKRQNAYSYIFEENIVNTKKENSTITISFKLEKRFLYRGEILLYDLYELFPDLKITVEELISIYYIDFITKVKHGDSNILKGILQAIDVNEFDNL